MKFYLLFIVVIFSSLSQAQNFVEIDRLIASDREERDRFGYDVAIDDNFAVVGAYGEGNGISLNRGAVYIYENVGGNWIETQKLEASDQENYDRFGWSVAINGNYIVVGAIGEDDDLNGANSLSKAGAAYIFKNNNGIWSETQKIIASDRSADDEFGWSVDISDSTLIVGAHQDFEDENGLNPIHHAGSAYIFQLNNSGNWVESQKIVGSTRAADMYYPNGYSGEDLSDQFGHHVGISGNYIVVGALHNDYDINGANASWAAGIVYVFEKNISGVWQEVQVIQNPEDRKPFDRFGSAVDVDTNFIAIGVYAEDESVNNTNEMMNSGSVYLYERDASGSWNYIQKITASQRNSGDHFGYDVKLDGSYLVTGVRHDNDDFNEQNELEDAGAAYIFKRNLSGQYDVVQKISASDRDSLDVFGYSVGISNVNIIVGAFQHHYNLSDSDSLNEAGKVYVFSGCSAPVNHSQTITLCDGESINVGSNTYNVTGIYNDVLTTPYGCDSVVETNLTILPPITTNQNIILCDGESITVGTSTYFSAGNYTDILQSIDGCDSVVNTNITENTAFEITQNVTVCYGESYQIGNSNYTTPGFYHDTLVMVNSNCDSIIHTNLSINPPLDLSIDANGNELESNQENAYYQWINCTNNEIINANQQSYIVSQSGNYGVILNQNGCVDTSACVYVNFVSLSEKSNPNFIVFPNPSNGKITISGNFSNENNILIVYNNIGKIVYKTHLKNQSLNLDLSGYPKGFYTVQVRTNKGTNTQKLILN